MNLRALIAALPWLRRLWRWLPGPLRVVALGIAVVVWVVQRIRGDDDPPSLDQVDDRDVA